MRFLEMQAARAWGLTPAQWDNLDNLDRAEMMALRRAEAIMEGYEHEEAERKAALNKNA